MTSLILDFPSWTSCPGLPDNLSKQIFKRFKIKENNNPTATAYFPRRHSYSQSNNQRAKSRDQSSRDQQGPTSRESREDRRKSIFCQGNYDIGAQSLADQSMREAIIKKTLKGDH